MHVPKPELEEVILRGLQLRLSNYLFSIIFMQAVYALLSVSAWNTFYQITIWSLVYIFTVSQDDLTKNMRQLQGGFAPLTPDQGFAPGPHWGPRPQTPI